MFVKYQLMFLAQALKMSKISLRKRQIFKSYLYPDIATLSIDIDIITQNTFKILSFHILPEVQQCNSFTLQYLTSRLLKSLHFTIKREVNGHLISQYKLRKMMWMHWTCQNQNVLVAFRFATVGGKTALMKLPGMR